MNKHSRQNHSAEQAGTVIYSFICPTVFSQRAARSGGGGAQAGWGWG